MSRLRFAVTLKMLLLLLLFPSSCRKKPIPVKCYICEMTYDNGAAAGTQYPCVGNIGQWQQEQRDNTGRPLQSNCKEQ